MKYFVEASKNWKHLETLGLSKVFYYLDNNNIGDDGMDCLT